MDKENKQRNLSFAKNLALVVGIGFFAVQANNYDQTRYELKNMHNSKEIAKTFVNNYSSKSFFDKLGSLGSYSAYNSYLRSSEKNTNYLSSIQEKK